MTRYLKFELKTDERLRNKGIWEVDSVFAQGRLKRNFFLSVLPRDVLLQVILAPYSCPPSLQRLSHTLLKATVLFALQKLHFSNTEGFFEETYHFLDLSIPAVYVDVKFITIMNDKFEDWINCILLVF